MADPHPDNDRNPDLPIWETARCDACRPSPESTEAMWTDPDVDPAARDGRPDELRASHWIANPDDGDEEFVVGDDEVLTGWAYAEVACGHRPIVGFRIPTHDSGWVDLSAADAEAVGALLIRISGAARAAVAHGL